jgi:tetratricopeptide (TPR) repeat protein
VSVTALVIVVIAAYFIIDRYQISTKPSDDGWINSIAVIPFHDLSPTQDKAYFCEGLAGTLIDRLTTIENLKVTSLTSVRRFQDEDDFQKIADQLKVKNILTGTITVVEDSIRLRTELIDVDDESILWSNSYDREMNSIFALEDEISRTIAGVLEIQFSGTKAAALVNKGTDNIEAYKAYLQGRYFWRKRQYDHLLKAVDLFKSAIELDRNYTQAYSGLCDTYIMLHGYGISAPEEEKELLEKASDAIEQALEIDPNLAEVQASYGQVLRIKAAFSTGALSDMEKSREAFERAIAMNPGYVWSHVWLGILFGDMGLENEDERETRLAYELDPLSAVTMNSMAANYLQTGKQEDAIEMYKDIIEIEPSYPSSYYNLALWYSKTGTYDTALNYADQYANRCLESFYEPTMLRGLIYANMGVFKSADRYFLEAIELAPGRWWPYSEYARFLNRDNRFEEAADYYEKAVALSPNQLSVRSSYGYLLASNLGKLEDGLSHLNHVIRINPRHASSYNRMGYLYAMADRRDSALWAIDKAIEVENNDFKRLVYIDSKAEAYATFGRLDSAISIYKYCLEQKPDDRDLIFYLGRIYTANAEYLLADSMFSLNLTTALSPISRGYSQYHRAKPLLHQGKFRETLAMFKAGIVKDSADIGNCAPMMLKYYSRGRIYSDYLNDMDSAIAEFKRAEEVNQGYSGATYWTIILNGVTAQAVAKKGMIDSALIILESLYQKIDKSDTKNINKYNSFLAGVLSLNGKHDTAITLFENEYETIDIGNQFAIIKKLGEAYLKAGRYQSAINLFEKGLSRYDVNRLNYPARSVFVEYLLAKAYDGAGRNEEAIRQYETFLNIWKNADERLESVEDAKSRLARLTGKS